MGLIFMTAFTTAQLPTGGNACDTVEKLFVWCAEILAENAGGLQMIREEGETAQSVARRNFYTDRDRVARCQAVMQIPMVANWSSDRTKASWANATEITTVAIPSSYSN
jgi:hypothetical protein